MSDKLTILSRDSDIGWQKGWRKELGQAYSPTRESIQPLLKDWLLVSQKGMGPAKL